MTEAEAASTDNGDTNPPAGLTQAAFHGPLSETRAARVVARLARNQPRTVLDIGCGWGELMLRILEAVPGATGVGLDLHEPDLARGRDNARSRGLADRAAFVRESGVGTTREPADLVLCLGASHALTEAEPPAHTVAALAELRRLVTPGGRVLLGEGFWHRPPAPAELAAMWPGMTIDQQYDLATLTDLTVQAGFRLAWIETATGEEWEDFESAYQCDQEEWLAGHPDHPGAAGLREKLDQHRSFWLRGYYGILGIAYLTLIPAGQPAGDGQPAANGQRPAQGS
jgi:SAM-dependent methyltransferase